MIGYKTILNNKEAIKKFSNIDKMNLYSFSHGLKRIKKDVHIASFNKEIKDSKYYNDIIDSLEKYDNIELDQSDSLMKILLKKNIMNL